MIDTITLSCRRLECKPLPIGENHGIVFLRRQKKRWGNDLCDIGPARLRRGETGKAAAKGGFTTVVLMANTKPCVDNTDTLQYIVNKGKETDINVLTCATITKDLKGKELVDMNSLLSAGAVGFTDDGIPILEESIVREAMLKAKELNVPLSFH